MIAVVAVLKACTAAVLIGVMRLDSRVALSTVLGTYHKVDKICFLSVTCDRDSGWGDVHICLQHSTPERGARSSG